MNGNQPVLSVNRNALGKIWVLFVSNALTFGNEVFCAELADISRDAFVTSHVIFVVGFVHETFSALITPKCRLLQVDVRYVALYKGKVR